MTADTDLTWQHKGWPETSRPVPLSEVGEQGWNLFTSDFLFPVMTLNQAAVHHNVQTMSRFCRDMGVSLAPHGKAMMSPELARLQLDAGAQGITVATVGQARVYRKFGVEWILIANQVVDSGAVRWAWDEIQASPGLHLFCLVDSIECVEVMEVSLEGLPAGRRIEAIVELGVEKGRTGARTIEAAIGVASRVAQSDRLNLAGVGGYEGIIPHEGNDFSPIDAFLFRIRELTEQLAKQDAFDHLPEVIVTAGGSMFPDRVVDILGDGWDIGRPVRVVLRAGAYAAHDSVLYGRNGPFGARPPMDAYPALIPALTLWGCIISRPEPDLAIAGFGKRDVSFDIDLPVLTHARRGVEVTAVNGGAEVFDVNDQHAYLRVPAGFDMAVGTIVGCGISHPCTSFDRWRAIPLVNDEYDVVGAIRTFF